MSDTANKAAKLGGQIQLLPPAEKNQWPVYNFRIMYEEMQWLIIEFLMEKDLTSAKQECLPCSDETNISGTNIFRGRIYVYLYMYL